MDAKLHSTVTGDIAKISKKEGSNYSAFSGYITDKNLKLVAGELIVQTWRAIDWKKLDIDSIFIIRLEKKGKDTVLNMVHANLPDEHAQSIKSGWNDYYWTPWKAYISGQKDKKRI